jgi:hypothetical protein
MVIKDKVRRFGSVPEHHWNPAPVSANRAFQRARKNMVNDKPT